MASRILKDSISVPVPPEIVNNIGALYHKLGQLDLAQKSYDLSLFRCQHESSLQDDSYFSTLSVTIRYNLARLHEALYQTDSAESIYKSILKDHPNYIDCYLRLGCMARDREQIYEASHWFKEALQIDHDHPDPWSLIGNLHLSKSEFGPGQKKFELILQRPQTSQDQYSSLSLGNVWLQTLYQPMKDRSKEKRHQDRALNCFRDVLKRNPRNLFAANGIGAVLAHKGFIQEARSIFAQVRDATADIPDVWLNLAHIFVEQKQFVSAIQLYTNCLNRFYKGNNTDIMVFVAQANFKNGDLNKCKIILLRARHLSPSDHVILFNLAFVIEKLAISILKQVRSHLKDVLSAVRELELAQKYFHFLSKLTDGRSKLDPYQANLEAKSCSDILSQAQHHVSRARKLDEEESIFREQQEQAKEEMKARVEEERRERVKIGEENLKVQREKREEFKRFAEERLRFVDGEKEIKESKKRSKKSEVRVISDDEDGIIYERSRKKKLKTGSGKRSMVGKKREKIGIVVKSKGKHRVREGTKNPKIKSKEFVDSEDDSSDKIMQSYTIPKRRSDSEPESENEGDSEAYTYIAKSIVQKETFSIEGDQGKVLSNYPKDYGKESLKRRAKISESDSSLDFDKID